MDLVGRVALVTGGSGDLGTAISLALARAGCDIALTYVGNRDGAARTVEAVEQLGRRTCALPLDQTDAGDRLHRRPGRGRPRAPRHPRQQCRVEYRDPLP